MANAPVASSTPSNAAPAATTVPAADPKNAVAPATAPVSKAPVAEETWDVQENGQVVKKTRKEIIDAYQLRKLSDKKRSEAEKQMAEYNNVFAAYKKDPIKFMKATGVDFDNLATSYLAKKAEDSMKDPKEVEAARMAAELETYKQYVAEQKENTTKLASEAAIGREREKIHKEIIEALQEKSAELGMPVDEDMVIAVAQQMMVQDKAKKPLNAKEALPAAYAKTQKWLQGMASKMEGEAIVKWLGEDTAKKIRKYDLMQLKSKRAAVSPTASSAVKPQKGEKAAPAKPYKNWSTFKAELDEKYK